MPPSHASHSAIPKRSVAAKPEGPTVWFAPSCVYRACSEPPHGELVGIVPKDLQRHERHAKDDIPAHESSVRSVMAVVTITMQIKIHNGCIVVKTRRRTIKPPPFRATHP
jgi:hypothetical protein